MSDKPTLLERWDDSHTEAMRWKPDEIRRAIAIAQAVEDGGTTFQGDKDAIIVLDWIMRRADELLEVK